MIHMSNISAVLSTLLPNVRKSGEVLIRLPVPVVNFRFGEFPISPQMINMINMINVSPVLATVSKN